VPVTTLRALRGATTVDEDVEAHVHERVVELLDQMCERNGIDHEDVVSILFTATDDVHSTFPAAGARKAGFGDVPLICARELDITGATPLCLRVMMHLYTERSRTDLHHIYLHGAVALRDDLPE
jgi:chorismate mutase